VQNTLHDTLKALVNSEFAKFGATENQTAVASPPRFGWIVRLTPPFPESWPPAPDSPLLFFAYADRLRSGLFDGCEVARPWGRFECHANGVMRYQQLLHELESLGIQGVGFATAHERDVLNALQAEGGYEKLLPRVAHDPDAALLLRRCYCQWLSGSGVVGEAVLRLHPLLRTALDCSSLSKPAPPPAQH
jgi:hypothetical protein